MEDRVVVLSTPARRGGSRRADGIDAVTALSS